MTQSRMDGPLAGWVHKHAEATPGASAVVEGDAEWTYADLAGNVDGIAARLTAAGAQSGDRIGLLSPNSAATVALFFACARLDLVLVPLSVRLTPRELSQQVDDADLALLLHAPHLSAQAAVTVEAATTTPPLAAHGLPGALPDVRRADGDPSAPKDAVLLLFTSGTTGRAKGALLTRRGCAATNHALGQTFPLTADDRVLLILPQYHVAGWNVLPLLAWSAGACVLLDAEFDPDRALARITGDGITAMMGVPATWQLLAEHPSFPTTNLSTLRTAVVGGAAFTEAVVTAWRDRGARLAQGYGLTEAGPNVLCQPAAVARGMPGEVGRPYDTVEVALADPRTGARLDGPATGELLVRGPSLFAGYWRDPAATEQALRDGWLHTGDVVERDEQGIFWVRGRLTDVYVSGGENVYPAEVEQALAAHPAVDEVAVLPVPDERWGEAGVAVVVLRAGSAATTDELLAYARERLAGFKVPHEVHVVESLPHTASGKVRKAPLRALLVGQAPR